MNRKLCVWMVLLCAAPGAAVARAEPVKLDPNQSVYELHMGPMMLGHARFTLAPAGAENCYRYEYVAVPQGMAKMFVGTIHEFSDFCVTAQGMQSRHYEFHRADRPHKDYVLEFDWQKGVLRGGEPAEQQLPPGTLDRLAIQQAVRQWVIAHAGDDKPPDEVEFTMGDRKRVVTYRFALGRREKVKVPAGQFDTIIVQRVDNPEKTLRFWLAPERDYTPVKVIQDQEGQPELRMYLQ